MRTLALGCCLSLALASSPRSDEPAKDAATAPAEKPLIQLALLLDTSNSMDGMINQARNQLWAIVNEFLSANRDGVRPRLQVGLYHYGTPTLGSDNGYVRQLAPLTEDLDQISEELFQLRTNGGDEYCGWVIRSAVNELKWSPSTKDYKAVFIAGNEPFSQGPVDYRESCKAAIEKGIIVNTIHCAGGNNAHWKEGAQLADGRAMSIDGNQAVVEVETPQDKEIAELSAELNKTYIAYGAKGKKQLERQAANDASSMRFGVSNASKRAVTKANSYYVNTSWDLVDAVNNDAVKLDEVKDSALPEALRGKSPEELKQVVAERTAERKAIQSKINDLAKARATFIAEKQKELATNDKTLGNQVKSLVVEQAEKAGFDF